MKKDKLQHNYYSNIIIVLDQLVGELLFNDITFLKNIINKSELIDVFELSIKNPLNIIFCILTNEIEKNRYLVFREDTIGAKVLAKFINMGVTIDFKTNNEYSKSNKKINPLKHTITIVLDFFKKIKHNQNLLLVLKLIKNICSDDINYAICVATTLMISKILVPTLKYIDGDYEIRKILQHIVTTIFSDINKYNIESIVEHISIYDGSIQYGIVEFITYDLTVENIDYYYSHKEDLAYITNFVKKNIASLLDTNLDRYMIHIDYNNNVQKIVSSWKKISQTDIALLAIKTQFRELILENIAKIITFGAILYKL